MNYEIYNFAKIHYYFELLKNKLSFRQMQFPFPSGERHFV